MKIAILGTRGIPNQYGGFEQCAEKIAPLLVASGITVDVYCPKNHAYVETKWNDVELIHISSFPWLHAMGSLFYDFFCIVKARKGRYDAVLQLGYSPAGLFYFILQSAGIPIVTNMAGMEWRRSKWGIIAKLIIKYSERLAVRRSQAVIADNIGIKNYIDNRYKINSDFITYGAAPAASGGDRLLCLYNIKPDEYYMLLARFQSDNNIEMILDGYCMSGDTRTFIVVGGTSGKYGRYLLKKYSKIERIIFTGGVYDYPGLCDLRRQCRFYFHGHSAGGTNPSLLEAMSSGARLVAHGNDFNRAVLGGNSLYFNSAEDVRDIIANGIQAYNEEWKKVNLEEISTSYQWEKIARQYLEVLTRVVTHEPRSSA